MKPENEKIEINETINSNTQIKKNAISFEINFNDIEVGDILEAYSLKQI